MDDSPLIRAILAAPDDDAPRLVYADWLDDHGNADRARFIRVQVELARLSRDHPRRIALGQAERTLWRANREGWTAWVPPWAEVTGFRRGFLERIRCDATAYLAGADDIRRRTPLTGVRLDGPGEIAVPLFRSRALDGLRSLTLSVEVPAVAWAHFAECPYLGGLEQLDLNSKGPAAELVTALVESSGLGALRDLRLKWGGLGDEQTARLVRHPWVARLRSLDLASNHIFVEGGQAILKSPHLDGLEWLNLRGNPVAESWVARQLEQRFGGRVRI